MNTFEIVAFYIGLVLVGLSGLIIARSIFIGIIIVISEKFANFLLKREKAKKA